jgi:hypothetical protein
LRQPIFRRAIERSGYTGEFAYLDPDEMITRQAEQEAKELMILILQRLPATP